MITMAQDAVMLHQHARTDAPRLPVEGVGYIFWQGTAENLCRNHMYIIGHVLLML